MTTPPDTPKPPVTMQEAVAWIEQLGHDSGTGPQRDACYMLANAGRQFSPQESHKLAEELERRCQELAQAHPHHVNGPIHNIAALVMTHRDAILAAMRSSGQELENIRASHKWCIDLARTVIVTEDARAIEWYVQHLVDELQQAWQEIEALRSSPSEQTPSVDNMVKHFLCWPLPKTFAPDCGISFDGRKDDEWNKNKTWPIGTNLFTADEARAMFEHAIAASGGAQGDGNG